MKFEKRNEGVTPHYVYWVARAEVSNYRTTPVRLGHIMWNTQRKSYCFTTVIQDYFVEELEEIAAFIRDANADHSINYQGA